MRQVKSFYFTPDLLMKLLRGDALIKTEAFPEDAHLVYMEFDMHSNSFRFIVESKEYPQRQDGWAIPTEPVTYTNIATDAASVMRLVARIAYLIPEVNNGQSEVQSP